MVGQQSLHPALTPEIALSCQAQDGQATLMLELTGPAGLDMLDMVHVRICDDVSLRQRAPRSLAGGTDLRQIVGPYRVKSGLQHSDPDGRAHGPFPLPRNEPYPILLEQRMPLPQKDRHARRGQNHKSTVRVEVTCLRAGHELWVLPAEVNVPCPADR